MGLVRRPHTVSLVFFLPRPDRCVSVGFRQRRSLNARAHRVESAV